MSYGEGGVKGIIHNWSGWTPFLPFPMNIGEELQIEHLINLLIVKKYLSSETGMKHLRDITIKYLDTVGEMVQTLGRAGTAHWSVAMINNKMLMYIFRTLGLMSEPDVKSTSDFYWKVKTEFQILQGIDSVGTIIFGSKGVGSLAPLVSAVKASGGT